MIPAVSIFRTNQKKSELADNPARTLQEPGDNLKKTEKKLKKNLATRKSDLKVSLKEKTSARNSRMKRNSKCTLEAAERRGWGPTLGRQRGKVFQLPLASLQVAGLASLRHAQSHLPWSDIPSFLMVYPIIHVTRHL